MRRVSTLIFSNYRRSFEGLSREVWLLSLVMLINRTGMMVLPFLSVFLHNAHGFSLRYTGLAMGFFGAGSIAGAWLGGVLTDRFGFFKVQMGSLILSGLMFLILLTGDSFIFFCTVLFFTSLITDSFRPANLSAIGAYSKMENRTRSLSLIRMAVNLGFAVGPAVGGFLIVWQGYKSIFWINAAGMFIAAIVMYNSLHGKEPRKEGSEETDAVTVQRHSPFKDPTFVLLLISMLLTVLAFVQLLSTIPVHFKEIGFDEDAIGLFMAYSCMIIVIFEMPLIYLLERRYSLHLLMAGGAVMIAAGYLSLIILPVPIIAVLGYMTAISFGEIITFPTANSQALALAGKKRAGKYMGLFTMTFSLSFVLAPTVGMIVAETYGFHTLWFISAIIGLMGATGFLLLGRKVRSQTVSGFQ